MDIAIIQFPGSNCERETAMAVRRSGMNPVFVLWNAPFESLAHYDGFIIVGGFSYEDRSRSGVIAAKQPIMKTLQEQAAIGKPILGICNGAQILIESGLVPDRDAVLGCLTHNRVHENGIEKLLGFYNEWVYIRANDRSAHHAFLNQVKPHTAYRMPMANAEGRFVFPDNVVLMIEENGGNLYYCDKHGDNDLDESCNPNGSVHHLAAVSNLDGNVMAIMPHPERCEEGQFIFDSMRVFIQERRYRSMQKKQWQSVAWIEAFKHKLEPKQHAFIVKSHIQDNTADTVMMLLAQRGIQVSIAHHRYWTFHCNTLGTLENNALHESGQLYNAHKESLIPLEDFLQSQSSIVMLTQSQYSKNRYDIELTFSRLFHTREIQGIEEGKVWVIDGCDEEKNKALAYLLKENILQNPVEHQAMFLQSGNDRRIHAILDAVSIADYPSTNPLPASLGEILYAGKVRSLQSSGDHWMMTTHDRTSAFDRPICDIMHKGLLLNLLNTWWLKQTQTIIPNHWISTQNPNQMQIKPLTPISLEVVVRGYLCGNTQTSLWTLYQNGVRQIDETILQDGMQEYDALPIPIITPTIKAKDHDTPILEKEILATQLLTPSQWHFIKTKSLELFAFGQMVALSKGLILADTKYEFGFDRDGNILLMDECHTPDSSRYWLAQSYDASSQSQGLHGRKPKPLGKDTLRQWLKDHFNPYEDAHCPSIPEPLLKQLSQEYYEVYARLTGDAMLDQHHFLDDGFCDLQKGIASCVA